jgi:hypothetical protein
MPLGDALTKLMSANRSPLSFSHSRNLNSNPYRIDRFLRGENTIQTIQLQGQRQS